MVLYECILIGWLLAAHQASGVTVGEWQSMGSVYRGGSGGNYAQAGADTSSRQYNSSASASANYPYFGASTNQSYNKWYWAAGLSGVNAEATLNSVDWLLM